MLTLRARFLVPVTAPAIENGAVVIDGSKIVEVGPAKSLSQGGVIDYGDAVLCPGFVNGHTHLELTHLADRVPPSHDFTDWLLRLMREFSAEPPDRERIQSATRTGIVQSLRAGVTTVGDITRFPHWTREVFAASPLGGVSFGEVIAIGSRRHVLQARLAAALDTTWTNSRFQIGVSPHAPYTVEPDAMRRCAQVAASAQAPLCVHLAETRNERDFTLCREGPFVDYLRTVGVWDNDIVCVKLHPVALARSTGLLTPSTIIAHANYVSDEDIATLASTRTSVAYCPRTHHAFGHDPHRFRDMIDAGVNVCIGTDSLASNPSLSVLDELRFLRRAQPAVAPDLLLRMATLNGASALGLADQVGALTPGKQADLAVIPLNAADSAADWTSLLDTSNNPSVVYAGGMPIDDRS